MIPAVAFVGPSQVGKTTLIESVIVELKKRGFRVAAIKHSGHELIVDAPLKDSWRFAQAGSDFVVTVSDEATLCVRAGGAQISVEAALKLADGLADIALVEGFRQSALPKIQVHKCEVSPEFTATQDTLLAVVTDERLAVDVPQFEFADVPGIADLIVRRLVRTAQGDVRLVVNGKDLYLKPFMKLIIARTVLAMVSSLKGSGAIRSLELSVKNPGGKWGSKYEGWNPDD